MRLLRGAGAFDALLDDPIRLEQQGWWDGERDSRHRQPQRVQRRVGDRGSGVLRDQVVAPLLPASLRPTRVDGVGKAVKLRYLNSAARVATSSTAALFLLLAGAVHFSAEL